MTACRDINGKFVSCSSPRALAPAVRAAVKAEPGSMAKGEKAIAAAVQKAAFNNLFHAAASIRKTAAQSVVRAPQGVPSKPGSPPHTHRRIFFRRAIRFFVDKQRQESLIGFSGQVIGDVGAVHEFGLRRDGVQFPQRPTLGPALAASIGRIAGQWKSSIGST